jgi:hypothetical protein
MATETRKPRKPRNPLPPLPAGTANGRHPDPQGGRVHNVQTKVSVYEAEVLAVEKKRMEGQLGKRLTDSAFVRLRLLNGGAKLTVRYPQMPPDTRREKRGSRPRPPRADAEEKQDSTGAE